MTDYYRQAIDAAVAELDKPLADLTPEEEMDLAGKVLDVLVDWGVFQEVDGELRGGPKLLAANYAYMESS